MESERGVEEEVASGISPISPSQDLAQQLKEVLGEASDKISISLSNQLKQYLDQINIGIERLEEEIGKLRKSLEDVSKSMTSVVVDLRTAIADLSNPFITGGNVNGGNSKVKQRTINDEMFSRLVTTLSNAIDNYGLERVLEMLRGYTESSVIDEELGSKLERMVRTLARLKEQNIDVKSVIDFLRSVLNSLRSSKKEIFS